MAGNKNIFDQTTEKLQLEAPEELIQGVREHILKLEGNSDMEHCLTLLEKRPTVLDVLIVSYILNGGVLLKQSSEVQPVELEDLESFFRQNGLDGE